MEETSSNSLEESAYSTLYKYSGKSLSVSLQQRVDRFLTNLKDKRHSEVDKNRNFSELFFGVSLAEDNEDGAVSEKGVRSKQKKITFELMQSERFTEIPYEFKENWFVKFCPDGFRVLIIARNHTTMCCSRRGKVLFYLKTNLPGGGKENSNGLTVLDCVYNKISKTIFIIDCLCWNSMSLLNSEATFRFFWLNTKFDENPDLVNSGGRIKFYLMEHYPTDISLIQDKMFDVLKIDKHIVPYDGLAFYHKEGHYTSGITPLVGWVASFTISELLHIDVDPRHMQKKPEGYVCMQQYIEDLNNKKKRHHKFDDQSEMDFENCTN